MGRPKGPLGEWESFIKRTVEGRQTMNLMGKREAFSRATIRELYLEAGKGKSPRKKNPRRKREMLGMMVVGGGGMQGVNLETSSLVTGLPRPRAQGSHGASGKSRRAWAC